ncbi:MAG TPA: hypothetical protein VHR45_21705 [Thermoanaerobaculia bacterium]|nr:hypothetical protein [Thermoanaerobaculia bacterium]
MTRFLTAAGSLLLIAALTTPAVAQTRQSPKRSYPIPKTLTLNNATLPTWVDASVALTEDGKLNPDVWGSETRRIREILETPSDHPVFFNDKVVGYSDRSSAEGCRPVGATFFDYPDPPRRGTLDQAITDSHVALLGRVTDKAFGFYAADPGQLLQIEPLRSYGHPLPKARYYFFVPIARFRFAGVDICKTDERYAEPPAIGDEVFLFVGKPADRSGVLLDVLDPGDIVPVAPEGSLRLPRQYSAAEQGVTQRASARGTKDDLLARMQALRAKGAAK